MLKYSGNILMRRCEIKFSKAEKPGLTVQIGGKELFADLYAMFARNMRELGTPVYGRVFFETILDVLPLHTRIFVVKFKDTSVAAGLSTIFQKTLEVLWTGSLAEYRSFCPNKLLYWEAIQYGIQQGMNTFDFGRSTPGEGTFKFKAQWGRKPILWFGNIGQKMQHLFPTSALPMRSLL